MTAKNTQASANGAAATGETITVYVNGKRRLTKRGRNITRVSISRLPKKRFVVKIVTTQNTGARIISTRVYDGCKKSRPHVRSRHPHRG